MVILEEWLHIPLRGPVAHGEQAVKAAEGASTEVALTCKTVDCATDVILRWRESIQFGLEEYVRSTVSGIFLGRLLHQISI